MSFSMFYSLTDVIGSLAACLTTASFVPQVWLSFKTRDVSGVSLSMYSVFTVGVALWLVYGLLLGAWPVVIANVITLVLALLILGMKLKYGGKPAAPPGAAALSSAPAPEQPVCGK
jgi:MtN3 and saliva related transmembrane protein